MPSKITVRWQGSVARRDSPGVGDVRELIQAFKNCAGHSGQPVWTPPSPVGILDYRRAAQEYYDSRLFELQNPRSFRLSHYIEITDMSAYRSGRPCRMSQTSRCSTAREVCLILTPASRHLNAAEAMFRMPGFFAATAGGGIDTAAHVRTVQCSKAGGDG